VVRGPVTCRAPSWPLVRAARHGLPGQLPEMIDAVRGDLALPLRQLGDLFDGLR